MFFDPTDFAWTATLEQRWTEILAELDRLEATAFEDWPEVNLYGRGWTAYALYFLGKRFPDNCAVCPVTDEIVSSIPGMKSAGFSRLEPGTHIRPHQGYSHSLLVAHLGLVIPPGCAIRVGNEQRGWTPGKMMIFDDMVDHEAWNRGDQTRTVLLLEVLRPGLDVDAFEIAPELEQLRGD